MNCPQCQQKAQNTGGGNPTQRGTIRYYTCSNCDIKFSLTGGLYLRILSDKPETTFRNRREMLRALYIGIRDELAWFGGISEESEELGRLAWRKMVEVRGKKG